MQIVKETFPSSLNTIFETLEKDGVSDTGDVKTLPPFEKQALFSVREAMKQALELFQEVTDVTRAAQILEKIQVAAALAEKAAFLQRNERTRRWSHLAQRISSHCRERFHELKALRNLKIPASS